MKLTQDIAVPGNVLSKEAIEQAVQTGLAEKFSGQRVLVLIPDHTRTLPLPSLFRVLVDLLRDVKNHDIQ